MAALGGTQVLPVDDGSFFIAERADFFAPALTVVDWSVGYGDYGTTWHEENLASTVPTSGQIWPRFG